MATFVGLKLDTSGSGGAMPASGGGLSSVNQPRNREHAELADPTPSPPARLHPPRARLPSPTPPTITGEQVVTMRKKNKKGKPVGKATLVGFTLDYSTRDEFWGRARISFRASRSPRRAPSAWRKRRSRCRKPVILTAAVYNPSTNSVTLNIQGNAKFTKGGRVPVNYSPPSGVSSETGVPPRREHHRVHHLAESDRHRACLSWDVHTRQGCRTSRTPRGVPVPHPADAATEVVIEVSGPVRLGRPLRATIREELGQIGGVGVTEELEDGNRYAICFPSLTADCCQYKSRPGFRPLRVV